MKSSEKVKTKGAGKLFELTAIPANLAKAFYICLNLHIMKSKGASERTNIAEEPIEFEIHLEST